VYRIDQGVIAMAAQHRGHERQSAEEIGQ